MTTLCDAALDILSTPCAKTKATETRTYAQAWREGSISEVGSATLPDRPARPDHPILMRASEMPKRGRGSTKNKIALLHALAHIELNAIDLAWDVMARGFDLGDFTLPKAFYDDWIKVADDEAKHHLMLEERLNDLGATYGDLPAHDGLWESSEKTAHDFAARLGIVPMVLEARGLDVTPGMIESMERQEDHKTADMLRVILEDEITHVRAGTVWFEAWCAHQGLDVETHWQDLVRKYFGTALKRPFNHPDREDAGMIRDWYEPMADEVYPAKSS
jgi:uncharacterized ferritin-like protein (DUF455 family)